MPTDPNINITFTAETSPAFDALAECKHELPVSMCDYCKPKPAPVSSPFDEPADVGPWFPAAFASRCESCGFGIEAGESIRYVDGQIECGACTDA
jgi:hypothetical protein